LIKSSSASSLLSSCAGPTGGLAPDDEDLAFDEWELALLPEAHADFRGMQDAEDCDGVSTAEALEAILAPRCWVLAPLN
jgi:hypothetical protein